MFRGQDGSDKRRNLEIAKSRLLCMNTCWQHFPKKFEMFGRQDGSDKRRNLEIAKTRLFCMNSCCAAMKIHITRLAPDLPSLQKTTIHVGNYY